MTAYDTAGTVLMSMTAECYCELSARAEQAGLVRPAL